MTIVYLSHGKRYSGTHCKKVLRYFNTLSAGLDAGCTHRAVLIQLGGVKWKLRTHYLCVIAFFFCCLILGGTRANSRNSTCKTTKTKREGKNE